MRHRKSVQRLGRTAAHRRATLANLSAALFERKHITTTVAKAKATRSFSERLITLAKRGTLHARRHALRKLRQKKIVNILFEDIAPQYADRPGGYTRVIKIGQRPGDGAQMAVIELVGFDTAKKKKKEKDKAKETETKKRKKAKAEEALEAKGSAEIKEPEKKADKTKKTSDQKVEKKKSEKKPKIDKEEKKGKEKGPAKKKR